MLSSSWSSCNQILYLQRYICICNLDVLIVISQFYFLFSLNQEGTLIPSIKSQFPLHKGVFNNIKFFHLFYLSCMYSKHVYVVHNKLFSFLICLLVFLPACACQPMLTSQIPINYTPVCMYKTQYLSTFRFCKHHYLDVTGWEKY